MGCSISFQKVMQNISIYMQKLTHFNSFSFERIPNVWLLSWQWSVCFSQVVCTIHGSELWCQILNAGNLYSAETNVQQSAWWDGHFKQPFQVGLLTTLFRVGQGLSLTLFFPRLVVPRDDLTAQYLQKHLSQSDVTKVLAVPHGFCNMWWRNLFNFQVW